MNTKTCTKCKETKSTDEFTPNGKYFAARCRPCNAAYQREWTAANRERSRATARRSHAKQGKRRYRTRKDRVNSLKAKPCEDCGVEYPSYVMDFDHRPGEIKEFGIGNSPNTSWERILKEAAKCDVVCANCHRIRTFTRGQYSDLKVD